MATQPCYKDVAIDSALKAGYSQAYKMLRGEKFNINRMGFDALGYFGNDVLIYSMVNKMMGDIDNDTQNKFTRIVAKTIGMDLTSVGIDLVENKKVDFMGTLKNDSLEYFLIYSLEEFGLTKFIRKTLKLDYSAPIPALTSINAYSGQK